MRFLMLNWRDPDNPIAGGAERVSLAYLAALAKRGHEVYWFANNFPGAARESTIDGIRLVRGGGKGTSVFKAIQWYRRQQPFDLVIDQHHGIPWFAPWWSRTNCVAYIHEVLGPIWNSFYPWPISALGQWQERWTHWFYRNVPFWTPSESTRRELQARGVREVTVIPNGCDTTPLAQLDPKPLESPVRLIVVCRLAPNKRVDHAIRTAKRLLDLQVDCRLTIVGTGEVQGELRRLAAELQLDRQVIFTGALSEQEKNEQLKLAHFLVHTSVREGWGLNVLEANAMGTPAIVYPVAGLVDSTVGGESGWITDAETPEAVASQIVEILKDRVGYDKCRHGAWERSKQFQWNQILPKACEWLEKMATRKSASGNNP